ncbi:ABC transporter substrate-binding protein [Methylobacterium brachiatum]|nr:ABC transporter substrate-binding protein [Methylobacterium brachiatum]
MKSSVAVFVLATHLALTVPTAAQVSGGVVRIGVLNDQSGIFADLGGQGSVIAARMAVEEAGGTVLGKPVEIIVGDHQNKPDTGSAIARGWIDTQGVDAIFDVPASATAIAVQDVTRDKNKMLFLSGPGSSDFTGKRCSPTTVHWTYDSYADANGTARALVKQGGDTWFFLTADNAGSHAQEQDATGFVKRAGGTVVGAVRHPFATHDFSSFLLRAQSSGAKVIGLANAGTDTITSVKQAREFGITSGGQKLASLLMFITDIHAIGLEDAQGLVFTDSFYWDMDDQTRAWSRRFMERHGGRAPTSVQAGVYGAVRHYLKAVAAAGTDETTAVARKVKELPVEDFWSAGFKIRQDGRLVRDMYLFQAKAPSESKAAWDYYKVLAKIPGDEAFRPVSEGSCPLVNQN